MLFLRKNNSDLNLFDEMNGFFDEFIKPKAGFMKTDIQEDEKGYVVEMDVPGVSKENIKLEVLDGYLNITVSHKEENDVEDKQSKYIRRERYIQTGSRSFYVGDISEDDIKAKFDNGVLVVSIPKKEPKVEPKKYIEIE